MERGRAAAERQLHDIEDAMDLFGFTLQEAAADAGVSIAAIEIKARRYGFLDLQQMATKIVVDQRRESGYWRSQREVARNKIRDAGRSRGRRAA